MDATRSMDHIVMFMWALFGRAALSSFRRACNQRLWPERSRVRQFASIFPAVGFPVFALFRSLSDTCRVLVHASDLLIKYL